MELTPGRIAVVTGASSGIGLALADRFARAGLHVVLADVDERGLGAAAEKVRTQIMDAARNWPAAFGEVPPPAPGVEAVITHVRRAIDEGMTPAAVADVVADAITAGRFWVFPHPEFVEIAARRWSTIAEGLDPTVAFEVPGVTLPG